MSSPEQPVPQPDQKPEFKLIMPSFPAPLPGIFEDVYADYLDNPESFMVTVGFRMEQDHNPLMARFIDDTMPYHAFIDVSTKWPAIYYEMYSRTSRRLGFPLPIITDKLVDQYLDLTMFQTGHVMEDFEERVDADIQRQKDEIKKRRTRDEALSAELAKFWNMVDQDTEGRIEDGAEDSRMLVYLLNLRLMQAVIQKQDDEYSLAEEYLLK